jgi:uncharacterized membrane protein
MYTKITATHLKSVIAYLFGFITGILFLIIEKDNQKVRFHAMQSTLVFGIFYILILLLESVPIVGGLLVLLLKILSIPLWIFLMVKAYQGQEYLLPYIGHIAKEQVGTFEKK